MLSSAPPRECAGRGGITVPSTTTDHVVARALEHAITVRRLSLEFPADLDPVVVEGCPEESYMHVGISLLLPHLEPYLIRSMRSAREHVRDRHLLADLEAFSGQEGQHFRQHARFNAALRLGGFVGLAQLEAEIEADYQRFTRSRSLRFNLAYAEGFEAFTTALSRFSFESKLLDRLHPAVRPLFLWHLVEELEHRTVAFDVYEHVCGGYFYRLGVGLFAQWHLNRFVLRVIDVMLGADREAFRKKYGGRVAAWARTRTLRRQKMTMFFPKVLATYLPWYSPHKIAMPAAARALADHYAALSSRVA
jgi:predicted metal-dependent hydrolase